MKFALSDDIISVLAVGEKRRLLKERRGDCNQRQWWEPATHSHYERHEEDLVSFLHQSLWKTWRGRKVSPWKRFCTCKIPHYIFTFYFTIFDLNISNLLQKLRWTPQSHPKARPGNLWLYQEGWVQSSCCTPYPHFHMVWWQHANYKLRHVPAQGMERWLQALLGKVSIQNMPSCWTVPSPG